MWTRMAFWCLCTVFVGVVTIAAAHPEAGDMLGEPTRANSAMVPRFSAPDCEQTGRGVSSQLRGECETQWSADFARRGPSGEVRASLVFDDGTGPALYVAGDFATAGGAIVRNIAKWDGQEWSGLNGTGGDGTDGPIAALAVYDDGTGPALFVGGSFSEAGGVPANRIARWNGHSWSSLGTGLQNGTSGSVSAMCVFDDGGGAALYVGGSFLSAGGTTANRIARWDGQGWSALESGTQIGLGGMARAMAVFDGGLYVGGSFPTAGGIPANNIARWDGQAWSSLGVGSQNGITHTVSAITTFDDGSGEALCVGGYIWSAGGVSVNRVARWNGVNWSALGSGIANGLEDFVSTLKEFDDGTGPALYVGGSFVNASGIMVLSIARWNGQAWASLGVPGTSAGVGGSVYTMTEFNSGPDRVLFVAGSFDTAGRIPVSQVARWSNQTWSAMPSQGGQLGMNRPVNALVEFEESSGAALFAGGDFNTAGDSRASSIVRLRDGAWSSVGPGLSSVTGQVFAATVANVSGPPQLYIAGNLGSVSGFSVNRIAQWNGQAWSRLAVVDEDGVEHDGVNGPVYAAVEFDDGSGPALYVGGAFTSAGGITANRVARWDGSAWSSLGVGAQNGVSGEVRALAVFDDGTGPALYAAGWFVNAGGTAANRIAKWNGQAWSRLGTATHNGASNPIFALAVHDDGSGSALFAAGQFTSAGGIAANRVARWNGQTWSSLGAGVVYAPASGMTIVRAMTVFDDGTGPALYVGGRFSSAGAVSAHCLARWRNQAWSNVGTDLLNGVGPASEQTIIYALTSFEDEIGPALYVGGSFLTAGGSPSANIARWGCAGETAPMCPADFDSNNLIEVTDIFAFLSDWFADRPAADFDNNGVREVADIFAFLAAWFAGCP